MALLGARPALLQAALADSVRAHAVTVNTVRVNMVIWSPEVLMQSPEVPMKSPAIVIRGPDSGASQTCLARLEGSSMNRESVVGPLLPAPKAAPPTGRARAKLQEPQLLL